MLMGFQDFTRFAQFSKSAIAFLAQEVRADLENWVDEAIVVYSLLEQEDYWQHAETGELTELRYRELAKQTGLTVEQVKIAVSLYHAYVGSLATRVKTHGRLLFCVDELLFFLTFGSLPIENVFLLDGQINYFDSADQRLSVLRMDNNELFLACREILYLTGAVYSYEEAIKKFAPDRWIEEFNHSTRFRKRS